MAGKCWREIKKKVLNNFNGLKCHFNKGAVLMNVNLNFKGVKCRYDENNINRENFNH